MSPEDQGRRATDILVVTDVSGLPPTDPPMVARLITVAEIRREEKLAKKGVQTTLISPRVTRVPMRCRKPDASWVEELERRRNRRSHGS